MQAHCYNSSKYSGSNLAQAFEERVEKCCHESRTSVCSEEIDHVHDHLQNVALVRLGEICKLFDDMWTAQRSAQSFFQDHSQGHDHYTISSADKVES